MAVLGSSLLHSTALVVALLGSVWSATTLNRLDQPTIDTRVPESFSQSAPTLIANANGVRMTPVEDEDELSRSSLEEFDGSVPNASLQQLARKRLEAEAKRSDALDPEQQLQKLQAASKRLSQLSSDKSIGEMSEQLRKAFDLSERATQPAAGAVETARFDPESAQLHDVLKEVNDDGSDRYVAVLLDAQGLTSTIPLSDEEGKKLHRVMQLMKSNPLLERVYRELAMPLLDQLLKKSPNDKQETTKQETTKSSKE